MKQLDNQEKDILREWIEITGKDNAPPGFTEKIMTRIALQKATSKIYTSPVSLTFKLGFIAVLTLLIVLAIVSSTQGELSFFDTVAERLGMFSLRLPDMPSLDKVIDNFSIILYIAAGIFLLIIFDRILNRMFQRVM